MHAQARILVVGQRAVLPLLHSCNSHSAPVAALLPPLGPMGLPGSHMWQAAGPHLCPSATPSSKHVWWDLPPLPRCSMRLCCMGRVV